MAETITTPNDRKKQLRAGDVVWFARERHEVVSLGARAVMLKSLSSKRQCSVLVADLLTAPDYSMDLDGRRVDSAPEATGEPIPEGLPKAAVTAAMRLAKEIVEVLTGYQSGSPIDRQPNEPRPEFNPATTELNERVQAKAKELRCSDRKVWRLIKSYKDGGVLGLIDHRATRARFAEVPAVVGLAITEEIKKRVPKTNITCKAFIELVEKNLRQQKLPKDFVMPSESTLRRIIMSREDGRALFKKAKSRRNASNRPKKAYTRFHAIRPGEIVLIDSTPVDLFALDPTTHEWISIQLTIAIDLYTRSLIAWRFSRETKAVDAALLLADMIRPKRSREFFGTAQSKPFVGVPESIIAHIDETDASDVDGELIPIPFLHPESVLIDQGKVFISEAFMSGCRHLGINLLLARPYTPTDKAHVERMFRTIRESFFCEIDGLQGTRHRFAW